MQANRMEMVLEASQRLSILEQKGLVPSVREDFENGRVGFLAPGFTPAVSAMIKREPKALAIALAGAEKASGGVAYLASILSADDGDWVSALIVRPDKRLWPQERQMLGMGFHVAYSTRADDFARKLHSVKVDVSAQGAVVLTDISGDVEEHWKKRMG